MYSVIKHLWLFEAGVLNLVLASSTVLFDIGHIYELWMF
jgi:hypothetical protein